MSGGAELSHPRRRPRGPARQPLVPVAIALVVGILLHDVLPARPLGLVVAAAGLAGIALLARWAATAQGALLLAVVAVGAASAQLAHYRYQSDAIALFAGDEPRLCEVEGVLHSSPRLLRPSPGGRVMTPKMTGLLRVERVRTWDGWREVSGTALLQMNAPVPTLSAGDRVRLFGWLERPGPAMNPGQFDFAAFYRGRRSPASLRVTGPDNVVALASTGPGVLGAARERARHALVAGFGMAGRDEATLLKAMFLGERDPAMADDRELFRQSGTGHFLAISGLHVGIVAGVAMAVARLAGLARRGTLLSAGVAVACYATVAEPSAPVLRAAILAVGVAAGVLLGRRVAGVQLLAAAALLLLVGFPLDVYRAGFQLSFVVVLGLILLAPAARRFADRAPEPEPPPMAFDDEDLRRVPDPDATPLRRVADKRVLEATVAAVVAWLAAMPLVALHFGQINVWSIPASLAAGPPAAASLVGGLVKTLASLAAPGAAGPLASVATWPVEALRATVAAFARLPWADVPLAAPPLWLVIATYAALVLAWWTSRGPPDAEDLAPEPGPVGVTPAPATAGPERAWSTSMIWWSRAPAATAFVAIFLMPTAFGRAPPAQLGEGRATRVTLLAVGAGQAAVIEPPSGAVTFVDAGSLSLGRPWKSAIGPFLRSRGIASIDRLVITHANFDHYNAVDDLVRRYGVREVVIAPGFVADARAEAAGRRLLAELEEADTSFRVVAAGDAIPLGVATSLEVLWPSRGLDGLSANDRSIIARLRHGGRSVLFTGDLQQDGLAGALAAAADLSADVLVAPHHGSTEPATAAFVAAVDPSHVVSSDSRRLSQKQRDLPGVLGGRPLLRTGSDGAIAVVLGGDGALSVAAFLDERDGSLTYPE